MAWYQSIGRKKYDLKDEFPYAFKPFRKVTVQDLMAVLRDHNVGTDLDRTEGYKLGTPYKLNQSTICARSTQYGFVTQLRSRLPVHIGIVIWIAQYRPDSQAFIPWYLGIEKMPEDYAYGNFKTALEQHFNPAKNIHERTDLHAFWSFVNLAEKVDENYGTRIIKVREKWNIIETEALKNQESFEAEVLKIFKNDPAEASELLTKYTGNLASKVWRQAQELVNESFR